MTSINLVAAAFVVICCAIIIGIGVYKNKETVTVDSFIKEYGDIVIEILQDTITILATNMDQFSSNEEYELTIIYNTINSIKSSATKLGIPENVVNLLSTDALSTIVTDILNKNKIEAFSVLDTETVDKYAEIIDDEVLEERGE